MEIPAPVQLLCDLEKYIWPIGDFPNKYLGIYESFQAGPSRLLTPKASGKVTFEVLQHTYIHMGIGLRN